MTGWIRGKEAWSAGFTDDTDGLRKTWVVRHDHFSFRVM